MVSYSSSPVLCRFSSHLMMFSLMVMFFAGQKAMEQKSVQINASRHGELRQVTNKGSLTVACAVSPTHGVSSDQTLFGITESVLQRPKMTKKMKEQVVGQGRNCKLHKELIKMKRMRLKKSDETCSVTICHLLSACSDIVYRYF